MGKLKARVSERICLSCGGCVSVCPKDAIQLQNLIAVVDPKKCISCKICMNTCSIGAISMEEY
jgi:ferredoxin